ncbi:MAG: aldo/keto reductase [bacterium]
MEKRKLGKSDLMVSSLGLGTMGMSEFYGSTDEKQSIETIHAALDNGINFIDTANMYGMGHNEILVGKAIKKKRSEVILATKFGIMRDEKANIVGLNGKPEYVKLSCEESLIRLDTDVIDLYYLHRLDPNTPIEETVEAMAKLVKEGKVRYIGLSEISAEILNRANKVHPITSVQSEYSLWSRDVEDGVLSECRNLDVSLVAYSPLGRGFLTGKIKSTEDLEVNDFRKNQPRFNDENLHKNLEIVKIIEEIADNKKIKPSQIALAWLLNKGKDIVPIPGTKRKTYLLENIESVNVFLTQEEIIKLDVLGELVVGTRYDSKRMTTLNK